MFKDKLQSTKLLLSAENGLKTSNNVLQNVACLTAVGGERLAGGYGSIVAVIDVSNIAGTGIEHQPRAVGIARGIV